MALHAPHKHIQCKDDREKFLIELFDTLWVRYRSRMEYVRKYEKLIEQHGARFINDHIAFRTIALQNPLAGIFSISRIFEALGYRAAACYDFADKHLNSIHFQHANPQFPKLFITQLKSWELSHGARRIISRALASHRAPLKDEIFATLADLPKVTDITRTKTMRALIHFFEDLPWKRPDGEGVYALDKETQYGAWVLLHGYDVNHFTASVDSHGVPELGDIEKVVDAMRKAGIPMKKEIEGERGSKLRQSSTESVVLDTPVKDGPRTMKISWPYAYFEIAERPWLKNPISGQPERFEGFLGGQATHLFEMTKKK